MNSEGNLSGVGNTNEV